MDRRVHFVHTLAAGILVGKVVLLSFAAVTRLFGPYLIRGKTLLADQPRDLDNQPVSQEMR